MIFDRYFPKLGGRTHQIDLFGSREAVTLSGLVQA